MKTLNLFSFLFVLVLLGSCNSDEPANVKFEDVQSEIQSVNNDYLFFANSETFKNTLEELKTLSSKELDLWE